jgi:outer membrane protein insertion porin family
MPTTRWISPLLLICAACVLVFAQTKSSVPPHPSYEGQKIASIDLIANPHVDVSHYRDLIVQQPGQPYSEKEIQASIHALQETNAFSAINVRVLPDPSGLKITFVLQPAFYIGIMRFPGAVERFHYARLLQAANIPDQTPYEQSQLPKTEDALRKLFQDSGYFQPAIHTDVQTDNENQLANLTFNVQLGRRARVGTVQILGPSAEESRRLQGAVHSFWARFTGGFLKTGVSYDEKRVKSAAGRIERKLGQEGHPANSVKANPPQFRPDTNHADVSFNVNIGPEVHIHVAGAKLSWLPFLARRRQRQLIPIYEENSIDPDLVTEGERNLSNFFQKKGYFDVSVRTDFQRHDDKVLLTYNVSKGMKYSVAEISFRGNHHIESDDLKHMVVVKQHRFLISRGKFSEKLLRNSVNGIKALYQEQGFEDVKVTPDVVNHQPRIYITFNVAEGDRTIVSSLKVEGNKAVPLSQLRPPDGFEQREGRPFSPKSLSADRNNIAAKYLDLGFLNSNVQTVVSRHPDNAHEVDVIYRVTEDQQVRISKVLYMGQQHTKSDLLHVATNLFPEQPLSEGQLLRSESNLYDLGIFDWASVGPRREIKDQPQEQALVKVHESKRNSITYGFGLQIARRGGNTPTGTIAVPGLPTIGTNGAAVFPSEKTFVSPRGSIEYTRHNVRGEGETGTISVLAERLDQSVLITYTDPHFRRSSWQTLTTLQAERNSENPLFVAQLENATVQFQRFLNRKKTLQLQAQYNFRHTILSQILVPELVLPADRNVQLSYVSGSVIRDTRDFALDAHHGMYQTVDLWVVPTAFGSSANFTRLFLQNAWYRPLPAGIVFANSIRLGFAKPFSGSNVPTSERFFAGGGTTLRGFPINEAGPLRYVPFCAPGQTTGCPTVPVPVGGNQLFIFNSELRFPIPIMNHLGGAAFYDGGNVYRRINFADFTRNYSNTVGIGLRYSTPIGPVRFDIGRNLNPPAGISATQFFITVGQAF